MKWRASLRWQLQLYYSAVLLVTLGILSGLAMHWMWENERYKFDSQMRDLQRLAIPILAGHARPGEGMLSQSPEFNRPPLPPGDAAGLPPDRRRQRSAGLHLRAMLEQGWCLAAWNLNGERKAASHNFPDFLKPDNISDNISEAIVRDNGGYRQLISQTPREVIVIAYPQKLYAEKAIQWMWGILALSGLLFLIATTVGWFLIGHALRPLQAIERTAGAIARGRLGERIQASEQQQNEIGALADNLNETFSKLEAMFERQARFTSDASHELRTPIAVILNHCQHGLSKERTQQEYQEALRACLRAGARMRNLTSSLLELARLESGEIQLDLAPCELGGIAREALELIEPLASNKGIVLKDETRELTARVNPDRLWQVLVNLLRNAIEYTPAGKVVTLRIEAENEHALISVIDQGKGIPASAIPHLFDRFYRVDAARARSREQDGFGLGLAICETIVKAHHGTIQVESVPGVETKFEIRLPLKGGS